MHFNLKQAMETNPNEIFKLLAHKGQKLTPEQAYAVVEYGIEKGYKTSDEISDEEIDAILEASSN